MKKYKKSLERNSIRMIIWRCRELKRQGLSVWRYLFLAGYFRTTRADTLDGLRLIFMRCGEETARYIGKLKEADFKIPYVGVRYEATSVITRQEIIGGEAQLLALCVLAPGNAKAEYFDGYAKIELPEENIRYVVLLHVQEDEVMASQGYSIEHDASVFRFVDEELEKIWAYHKTRGLIQLG